MRGRDLFSAPVPTRTDLRLPLVAVAVFWLAYDNGSYSLASRSTFAIVVWWTFAVAIAFGFARSSSLAWVTLATGGVLAALASWTLASSFWAPSAEAAFSDGNRALLYLGVYVLVVLLTSRRDLALWCNGLALAIVGVAAVALMSRMFPGVFPDRGLATFLPSSITRLSFPLGYWNGLATFVALAIPLLLRIAVVSRESVIRSFALAPFPLVAAAIYLTSSRGGVIAAAVGTAVFVGLAERRWRAVAAAAVAAVGSAAAVVILLQFDELVDGPLGTALVRRQGRDAAALLVVACAATAALHWGSSHVVLGRFRPRPEVARVAAAVAAVTVLAAAVAVHPVRQVEAFKRPPAAVQRIQPHDFVRSHLLSGSGNGRWQWWSTAIDQWKEHPLVGQGAGSFEQWWSEHASFTYFVRDAHSLYVETLGELGLVGFVLVLALVVGGVSIGVRRALVGEGDAQVSTAALTAVFAAYAVAAGIDWMWELPAVTVVAVLALGLVTGPATQDAALPRLARHDELPPLGTRYRFGLGVAALLVAWAAVGAQLIPLLAQRAIARSEAAIERGDLADAEGEATAARHIQPWAASPYLQLALVAEDRGQLMQARLRIDQAIERDSRSWRLWLVAARIDTKLGDVRRAAASLRRAIELNPRSPLFKGLLAGGG